MTLMAENDSDEMWDFLTEINEKDRRMEEESLTSVMHMAGSFSHNGGEVSSEFVFQ